MKNYQNPIIDFATIGGHTKALVYTNFPWISSSCTRVSRVRYIIAHNSGILVTRLDK